MRIFCNKNRVSFTLGVHQYIYQYIRALYFILVVSTAHSILKRKNYCIFAIFLS